MGEIGRGKWFNKNEDTSEESNLQKISGSYWNYAQYAYQIKNLLSFGFNRGGSREYAVCIDFDAVRKAPIDGDIVVIETSMGDFVERQVYQVRLKMNLRAGSSNWVLSPAFLPEPGVSIMMPHDKTEAIVDGKPVKIASLVIGFLMFME
jgi:hypothetical protein